MEAREKAGKAAPKGDKTEKGTLPEKKKGPKLDRKNLNSSGKVNLGESEFVESLNGKVGLVFEDDEIQEDFLVNEEASKNRPGQRARREKAERKFGAEAKHVKEGKGVTWTAGGSWKEETDPKKRKRDYFNNKIEAPSGVCRKERRKMQAAGETPPTAPKKQKVAEMHPSWVAKQAAKPAIAAFKGTKVTFD